MIGFATLTGIEKSPGRRKLLRRAGLFCNLANDKIPVILLLYGSSKVFTFGSTAVSLISIAPKPTPRNTLGSACSK